MLRFLSTLVVFAVAASAHAGPGPRVASPDGPIVVDLSTDNDGRPAYAVSRKGESIITPSRLGFLLLDAPKFERNIEIVQPRTRSVDETWEQPWGERRFIRNHYNELTVTLKEKAKPFRRFDVVFRVFDDGVGFRYRFPKQAGLEQVKIGEELTEFSLARDATAWWIPAGEWTARSTCTTARRWQQVGDAQTPITFKFDDGSHLSIHEAALVDYSGMNLTRVEDRRLKADLTPGIGEGKVVRAAPFDTPWRTLLLSDDAAGLAMSSLTLNLNEPNALGDVSWVKPMKYVGVWWEMHLELKSWASGPKHGATNENVRKHIDSPPSTASAAVLVEGWNVGWDGDWFGNGEDFSFTKSYPDFDLEALSAYARSKNVVLIGHHETSGNAAHYETQLGDAFDLYQRVGVPAVKTGYVATPARPRSPARMASGTMHGMKARTCGATPRRWSRKRPSATSRSIRTNRSRTAACAARIRTGSPVKARAAWSSAPGASRAIRPSTRPTWCSPACWPVRWITPPASSA